MIKGSLLATTTRSNDGNENTKKQYKHSDTEQRMWAYDDKLNPLSPSIHIQILQTDLRTFP